MRRVVVNTRGWLGTRAEPQPADVQLRYDPEDPFAVTVVVSRGAQRMTWVFARDLLADGIRSVAPLGEGDVRVQATAVLTDLTFTGVDGTTALLRVPWWNTREFVRLTEDEVPRGTEQCDVDSWVEALTARQEP